MISRSRGYLPHIVNSQSTYFVTFRLADSLPISLLLNWQNELRQQRKSGNPISEELFYEYDRKIENYLDKGHGDCWLKNPDIAEIVKNALRYFDGKRYVLYAWTIMPNHVHVLFTIIPGLTVSSILHSWKSFTAKQANKLLGTSGRFWQPEYFDRLITSRRQLEFTLRYILNNPVKAGLCKEFQEWPWFGCSSEMMHLVHRFFD
jgi:REP element-mobilizing transposase RayT